MATPIALQCSDQSLGLEDLILEGPSLDKELRNYLKDLWMTRYLFDLTICAKGQSIKTHKMLLAAHSLYIRDLQHLHITSQISLDVDPDILELVLTFVYNGKLKVREDKIGQIEETADFLQIDSLRRQCKQIILLKMPLKVDNCAEILSTAHVAGETSLATRALKMIVDNFQTVEHHAEFNELPFECVLQCLTHPDLQVSAPDERLAAGLTWVQKDREKREAYLSQILEELPLQEMQEWYIRRLLKDPQWKDNEEVVKILQTRLDNDSEQLEQHQATVCGEKETLLNLHKSTKLLLLVSITRNGQTNVWDQYLVHSYRCRVQKLHTNRRGMPLGTLDWSVTVCSDSNKIYMCGCGPNKDELWRCSLNGTNLGSFERLGLMMHCRLNACSIVVHGKLYIFGGANGRGMSCSSSIEVWDTWKKFSGPIPAGCLQYSHNRVYSRSVCALHCCYDQGLIVIYGATVSKTIRKHTIQIYSPVEQRVTHSLVLPREHDSRACNILPIKGDRFLLLADDYTAVVTRKAIIQNRPEDTVYCDDMYQLPNSGCSAALSAYGSHVTVYGGRPKGWCQVHSVYTARVDDIINNDGFGWREVYTPWPLGHAILHSWCVLNQ